MKDKKRYNKTIPKKKELVRDDGMTRGSFLKRMGIISAAPLVPLNLLPPSIEKKETKPPPPGEPRKFPKTNNKFSLFYKRNRIVSTHDFAIRMKNDIIDASYWRDSYRTLIPGPAQAFIDFSVDQYCAFYDLFSHDEALKFIITHEDGQWEGEGFIIECINSTDYCLKVTGKIIQI